MKQIRSLKAIKRLTEKDYDGVLNCLFTVNDYKEKLFYDLDRFLSAPNVKYQSISIFVSPLIWKICCLMCLRTASKFAHTTVGLIYFRVRIMCGYFFSK